MDHASVMLPPCSPAVIVTRRVPSIPTDTWHLTEVSDSHPVASHPVDPCRTWLLYPTSPNPTPCTVMLLDPVPAALLFIKVLTTATSAETASVMLPMVDPTVITTLCDP